MKKRLLCFLLIGLLSLTFILGGPVLADTPIWAHTYGGAEYDEVYALIECSGGGYAIAGVTRSYGPANQNGWLVRADSDGNHLWNQTYGGSNSDETYAVVECSNGDFALAGTEQSAGVGAWIIRTDENGHMLWNRTYDSGFSGGRDLVEASSGGFVLLATNHHGTAEDDLWLLRTDASGNPLWNRTYGNVGSDETDVALVECSNGDYAFLGITLGAGMMDDAWLIRTNSTGHHLWNHTYGIATENEFPYDLIEVSSGGFAFVGAQLGMWLVRTNASGTVLWEKTLSFSEGNARGHSLVECSDGGFAIAGFSEGWGTTSNDFLLVRTDANGDVLWYKTFGGSAWDTGKALVQTTNGDFLIAGETESFGAGLWDAWLMRTDDAPTATSPPPIPGFPLEALLLGIVLTLGIGVYYRRRRS